MTLSVVIPTLNAETTLSECLDRLSNAHELIVADGGSSDGTRQIALAAGAQVILAPQGRGRQLRAGVEASNGDWILILHADTFLSEGWRNAVKLHIRSAGDGAGYFRFRLRSNALRARLLERLVAARCRLFRLPYGDQGLLISRDLYDSVGGYAPLPMMEDVDLVNRIGAARLLPLAADAFTCALRWQAEGWLARSARNLACLLLFRLGVPAERIARFYR